MSTGSTRTPAIAGYAGLNTGDGSWTWQTPTSEGNDINAVACSDTTHCFAFSYNGSFGGILKTSNFGASWTYQSVSRFTNATCISATDCMAIGDAFGKTTTASTTQAWVGLPTNGGNSISCISASSCWITGNTGWIAMTTDTGITWPSVNMGWPEPNLHGIACLAIGPNCWAVGDSGYNGAAGTIFHTSNGTSWAAETSGTTQTLNAIACPASNSCWAVGNGGVILHTSDGTTWAAQTSGTTNNLHSIACPGTTTCYVTGDTFMTKTTDGATWNTIIGAPTLYTVACANTTTCMVGGPSGAIWGTTNGASFTPFFTSATTNALHSVACDSNIDCYAAGDSATILHTSDGATWAAQTDPVASQSLLGVSCPALHNCFMVGTNGTIVHTTDGSTWSAQTSGTTDYLANVACPDTSHCFVQASSGKVYVTSNAGTTWTQQTTGSNWLLSIACPTVNVCYAGSGGPTVGVYRTTNGGTTWTLTPFGDYLFTIVCPSVTNCYGLGYDMAHTTDGGASWYRPNYTNTYWYGGLACINTSSCLETEAFYQPTMYLSTDSGSHMAVQSDLGAQRTIHSIAIGDATHVYAVGDGGEILTSSNAFQSVPCKTAWMGVDNPSPQPYGNAAITFNGYSWGCATQPLWEFWVYASGNWYMVQSYSAKTSWTWDSTTAGSFPALGSKGTFSVVAWLKATGSSNAYDTFAAASFSFTGCDIGASTPNPLMVASPGPAQNLTTVAGGTGCVSPKYKVYMFNGTSWSTLQDWTPGAADGSSTFGVPTAGLASGNYSLDVHAVEGNVNTANGPETWGLSTMVVGTPTCNYVPTVTDAEGNPADDGAVVHFTASVGGSPCTAPLYKFWAFGPQGKWLMLQDWSSSATLALDTSTYAWTDNNNVGHVGLQPGTYSIVVHMKQPTSTAVYDTYAMESLSLRGCSSGYGWVSQAPVPVTKSIGIYAGANCDAPQYRYWMQTPGSSVWTMIQDWTGTSSLYWDTTGATLGNYIFKVEIKESGSPQNYDTFMLATSSVVSG